MIKLYTRRNSTINLYILIFALLSLIHLKSVEDDQLSNDNVLNKHSKMNDNPSDNNKESSLDEKTVVHSTHSSPLLDQPTTEEFDWNLFRNLHHNNLLQMSTNEQKVMIEQELPTYSNIIDALKSYSDISDDFFVFDIREKFEKIQVPSKYFPDWQGSGSNIKKQILLFFIEILSSQYAFMSDLVVGLIAVSFLYLLCLYMTMPCGQRCCRATSFSHFLYAALRKLNKVQTILSDDKYGKLMMKEDLLNKENEMIYTTNSSSTRRYQFCLCTINTLLIFGIIGLFTLSIFMSLYVIQDIRISALFGQKTPNQNFHSESENFGRIPGLVSLTKSIPWLMKTISEMRAVRLMSEKRPYIKFLKNLIQTNVEIINEKVEDLDNKMINFCNLNFFGNLINFEIDSNENKTLDKNATIGIEELNEMDLPLREIISAETSPARRFMEITQKQYLHEIMLSIKEIISGINNEANNVMDISKFAEKEEMAEIQSEQSDPTDHTRPQKVLPLKLSQAIEALSAVSTDGIEDSFTMIRKNLIDIRTFYLNDFIKYSANFSKYCFAESDNIFVTRNDIEAYLKAYLTILKNEVWIQIGAIIEKIYIPIDSLADFLDKVLKDLFLHIDYAILPICLAGIIISIIILILFVTTVCPQFGFMVRPSYFNQIRVELLVDCGSKIVHVFLILFAPLGLLMLLISIVNMNDVYRNKYSLMEPEKDEFGDFVPNILNQEPLGDVLNRYRYYFQNTNLITIRRMCNKNRALPFSFYTHNIYSIIFKKVNNDEVKIRSPAVSSFGSKEEIDKLRQIVAKLPKNLLKSQKQYTELNKFFQGLSELYTIMEYKRIYLTQIFTPEKLPEVIKNVMKIMAWTDEIQDLTSILDNSYDMWQHVRRIIIKDDESEDAKNTKVIDPFDIIDHVKYSVIETASKIQDLMTEELNEYTLSCNNVMNVIEDLLGRINTLFRILFAIMYTQSYIMLFLLCSGLVLVAQSNINKTLLMNNYIKMNKKYPFSEIYHKVFHIKDKFWIN